MIIDIPLKDGMITNADLEEIGTNPTELDNIDFSKIGTIKLRGDVGEETVFSSRSLSVLKYWVAPDGTLYFVGYDNDSSKEVVRYNSSFSSETVLGTIASRPTSIRIINFGNFLRFANGTADDPSVYQAIDRSFFWSGVSFDDFYYDSIARPRDTIASISTSNVTPDSGWFAVGATFYSDYLNLSSAVYYYRYSVVFDGNQESSLSDRVGDTGGTTGNKIPNIEFSIDTGSTLSAWNKRVTAINMYRSTSLDGTYYKIGSISTLNNDPNLTKVTGGGVHSSTSSGKVYLKDTTSSMSGKILLVNGYRKVLGAHDGSGVHTLAGGTSNNWGNTAYDGGTASSDDRAWRDPYTIINSNVVTFSDNGAFETSTALLADGWSSDDFGSDIIIEDPSSGLAIIGSNAVKLYQTGSGNNHLETPEITVSAGDVYYAEIWVRPDSVTSAGAMGMIFKSGTTSSLSDSSSGQTLTTITTANASTFVNGNGQTGWERITQELTIPSGHNRLALRFNTIEDDSGFYMDMLSIGVKASSGTECFGGIDVVTSENLDLGNLDSHKGFIYQRGSGGLEADERGFVKQNSKKAIRTNLMSTTATGTNIFLCSNYMYRNSSNNQTINFFDKGLVDGVESPTDTTSLDVKYSYSKYSDGRNFVGNVKITNGSDTETHKNWVMYSELSQPDVIPITNYIQIEDTQGGEIKGLASILGDIVVFMERGIYKLSVPVSDPSSWSLAESNESVGCIAPDSIVEYKDGVFFASYGNFYYLSSNFNAIPISEPIKDLYESASSIASTVAMVDEYKERLFVRFGTSDLFVLNLRNFPNSYDWSKWTLNSDSDDSSAINFDFLTKDNTTKIYIVDTQGSSEIREVEASTGDETFTIETGLDFKTGFIKLGKLDETKIIRRINLRLSSEDNQAVTVNVYTNGSSSTVYTKAITQTASSPEIVNLRIGRRASTVQVQLRSATNIEIRGLQIEVD